MYSYSQIALAVPRAITDCTRTHKSTDYCPNYTRKCVINYTNNNIIVVWCHRDNKLCLLKKWLMRLSGFLIFYHTILASSLTH